MFDTEINWVVFQAKFNGKEQASFERLSTCLFCYEHNKPYGIFAHKNQAGIETQPVEDGEEIIGFQAKYYGESITLSSKVKELQKAIATTKVKHPTITTICFYISREFGQSTKKYQQKTKYQTDVETFAQQHGVRVEWKCLRQIETILLKEERLSCVRDYFFNPQNGIKELYDNLAEHTRNILSDIESDIRISGETIRFQRSLQPIEDFMNSNTKCLLIHGPSGTGKSGIIRDFTMAREQKEHSTIFIFKATDFLGLSTIKNLERSFGDVAFKNFFLAFDKSDEKVIVIDAAEKVFLNNIRIIDEFITIASRNEWRLIFTLRDDDSANFISYIIKLRIYKFIIAF